MEKFYNLGDKIKRFRIKNGSAFETLTGYTKGRFFLYDSKRNLIKKYSLDVSVDTDYDELVFDGSDAIIFNIYRQDIAHLNGTEKLELDVLLGTPNASFLDGYLIDAWSVCLGDIKGLKSDTTANGI